MRKVIDITGIINNGMWSYGDPYPEINIKPLPPIDPVKGTVVGAEIFEGMNSQTGTYLETPAHYFGNGNSYSLMDVPVEKLIDVPCVVLNMGLWDMDLNHGRRGITVKDLEGCFNAGEIREGDAILLGTGWGRYWFHPEYLDYSPYITKEAMDWLIAKKPFILGGDSPRWENAVKPQGFLKDFFEANILMAAPLVNLEACTAARSKLTILTPKVAVTCCAPARAVVIEE